MAATAFSVQRFTLGAEIERLAQHHALPARSLGEKGDQLDADRGFAVRGLAAQDFEGEGEQRIADKDRRRLAVGDVDRGAPAAGVVVVHGRQVVMDQGVAVDAFERAGGIQSVCLLHPKNPGGFDEKEGPQPLAAAEGGIAHGFGQRAGGGRARGQYRLQARLDEGGNAVELGLESHGDAVGFRRLRRERSGVRP